jgi:hypothetical protein
MSKKSLKKEMVMKAQENYNYFLDDNKEVTVIWKKFDKACVLKVGTDYPTAIVDIDRLSGIPLTEEWLLKLGFVNNCLIIKGILFEVGHVGFDFVNNEMTLRINQFISLKIQHVHQLQNLFYSLTNQELS